MEITGKIVAILPTQSGTGSKGEWIKNAFVIEWQDNGYAQKLCLEVMGADKFEKMKNAVKVGYDVLCKFSVTSREWNGKYFTTASCFYCANVGGNTQQSQPVSTDPSKALREGEQAPAPVDAQLPF